MRGGAPCGAGVLRGGLRQKRNEHSKVRSQISLREKEGRMKEKGRDSEIIIHCKERPLKNWENVSIWLRYKMVL